MKCSECGEPLPITTIRCPRCSGTEPASSGNSELLTCAGDPVTHDQLCELWKLIKELAESPSFRSENLAAAKRLVHYGAS